MSADQSLGRVLAENVGLAGSRAHARRLAVREGVENGLGQGRGVTGRDETAEARRPRSRSGVPPTRVATTGRPAARASMRATGVPSLRDELTTTSRSP